MREKLEVLKEQVKNISRITCGFAALTTREGVRIITYNSAGEEMKEMKGMVYELAKNAGTTGCIQVGESQIIAGEESVAIPYGDYVLAASNSEKLDRENQLMKSLSDALPYIARVAEGEAVIFDSDGKRIINCDPFGNINESASGEASLAAKESIETQKTVIGHSTSVRNALAVRIPITQKFGFGFNNELRVKREKKMTEEVKKYQYANYNIFDIVGKSEKIVAVKDTCVHISKGKSSVMLYGETGTGKELFAQSIHNQSERRSKPFVAINCGAIPISIIESYLFGYTGGSFTGAKKEGGIGAFEQANLGTIFLDEISEMQYDLQVKLLRIIQEREVIRIGDFKPRKIDVRVIASTNRNLMELVKTGKFREDLYYRLNVVEIKIPSLRERKEDIPLLVNYFINKYNGLLGKCVINISKDALDILLNYEWPGNIRELQNCVERAINLVGFDEIIIEKRHLPMFLFSDESEHNNVENEEYFSIAHHIQRMEKELIFSALNRAGGSKKETAKLLGVSTITLWRKIKEYNITN